MFHLVATLLVRDEEEIVEPNLRHHLQQGVERFIVTDNDSKDRTRQIVAQFPEVVELIDEPRRDYAQGEFVTRMARRAYELGTEWVVHLDADEFWYGLEVLKEVSSHYGVVKIEPPSTCNHQPMEGHTQPGYFDPEDYPYYKKVYNPGRLVHRSAPNVTVEQGNHHVKAVPGHVYWTQRIRVHHYPLRSYERLVRKIKNGGEGYALYKGPRDHGTHWRQLDGLLCRDKLRSWYDGRVLTKDKIQKGLRTGKLKYFVPELRRAVDAGIIGGPVVGSEPPKGVGGTL